MDYTIDHFNQDLVFLTQPAMALLLTNITPDHHCPYCDGALPTMEEFSKGVGGTGIYALSGYGTDEQGDVLHFAIAHGECVAKGGDIPPLSNAIISVPVESHKGAMIIIINEIVALMRRRLNDDSAPVVINRCNLTRFVAERSGCPEYPLIFAPEFGTAPAPAAGPIEDTDPPVIVGKIAKQSLVLTRGVLNGDVSAINGSLFIGDESVMQEVFDIEFGVPQSD